jgi:hypothetical protein
MSDDERRRAKSLRESATIDTLSVFASGFIFAIFGGLLGALGGAIAMVITARLLELPFGQWIPHGLATFAILGAAYAGWSVWIPYRAQRAEERPLEEDVEGGVVEVLDVEAFIAWDEGGRVPGFSFDVGDGTPLVVRGDALRDAVGTGAFPCRRFTVVRLPVTKHALSVEPRGEPLPVRA